MTKLYTLTLEDSQGIIRKVEVAASSIIRALEKLDNLEELSEKDKLKNASYEYV